MTAPFGLPSACFGLLVWCASPTASQEDALEAAPFVEELSFPGGKASGLADLFAAQDGTLAASWIERAPATDSENAAARLCTATLDEDGWSPAQTVARGTDWFVNWVDVPRIAVLANGARCVTWLQKSGAGTYAYGVRLAASFDRGATWSEPIWLHDDRSPTEHGFVSLLPLDDETLLACWLDGRATLAAEESSEDAGAGSHGHGAGAMTLRARALDLSAGTIALGPESLIDERVCDCCPTAMAGTGRDGIVCVYRDRSEEEVRDIAYAFYGDGQWSAPGRLHEDGWRIDGCPVNGPTVLHSGGALASAWFTGAGQRGGSVLFSGSGRAGFAAPIVIDEGAPAGRVSLCALADGSVVALWLELEEGRAYWSVRRLISTPAGWQAQDAHSLVEVDSSRRSGVARIARHGDGAVFVWTSDEGLRALRLRF